MNIEMTCPVTDVVMTVPASLCTVRALETLQVLTWPCSACEPGRTHVDLDGRNVSRSPKVMEALQAGAFLDRYGDERNDPRVSR